MDNQDLTRGHHFTLQSNNKSGYILTVWSLTTIFFFLEEEEEAEEGEENLRQFNIQATA